VPESDEFAFQVFDDPLEVTPRLAALGLTESLLRDAVAYGAQHASSCTRHDPPGLPGYLRWAKTHRDVRDHLVPLGWKVDNTRNYPTVLHPGGQWALGVSSGDEITGRNVEKQPKTRNPKGEVTRQIARRNQPFFDFLGPEMNEVRSTWLLLFYLDVVEQEIRVELSLPKTVDGDGRVSGWITRLILRPIDLDDGFGARADDAPADEPPGDIDVLVERLPAV
jgi:hypothetical protein